MLNVLVVSLCKPVIQKSKLLAGGNLKNINQLGEPQKVGKQMLKFQGDKSLDSNLVGAGGREILEETVSVNFDHKVNFCSIFSLHTNDLSAEIATCFVLYVTQFSCLRVEVNISLQVAHAVKNPMIFSPSFNSVRLERKLIRQDYLSPKQLIFGPLNL